ncbi:hypothetical protein [Massilia alkalitolerans]|uniref:hypothetical protein n=1 Tax=Massilia alkalitolerans TaxID=286638 RepID=UPI00040D3A7E|nr:hypothetical protein [Massilia alkalitolerans]
MALTPPPAAPQRGDRATFAQRVDAFITWLINFVSELVGLVANLNSIAAGGAYALPYLFNSPAAAIGGAVGTASGGHLAFSNEATVLLIDTKNLQGVSVKAILNAISTSSSAVKGTLRIVKQSDPSTFAIYNITSYTEDAGGKYGYFAVSYVLENGLFAENDPVILHLQRTGDKGDTGAAAINPSAKFSDRKSSGVSGGTNVTGEQTRTLNTTDYNTAGVTLSGNQVTIQPGTYEIQGRAPAHAVGYHRASLYNVTDGTPALVGSSEYASPAGGVQSSSAFMGRIVLTTAKTFSVRHYTGQATTSTGLGNAVSVSGVNETYTELNITKVA